MKLTKITILSNSLGNGGAERMAGLLSVMCSRIPIEVHIIIVNDGVMYDHVGPLYNLDAHCKSTFNWFRKIEKGYLLYRYLLQNDITIVVDSRPRNNFIRDSISNFIFGKRKKIYLVHSSHLKTYLPNSIFLAQLLYKKAHKIICVSKAIEQQIITKYGFSNTQTIYNPFDFSKINTIENCVSTENYVLYFGRFDEKCKNFSLMLESFHKSRIYEKGYQLVLLGAGPDEAMIQSKIVEHALENKVIIYPFIADPSEYIKKAKFTILTSRYEGFPMSLIESLAHETPVLAVDCNSGPREIVQQEENGLLVENYNATALALAMKRLVEDEVLYLNCKKNARKSVEHLAIDNIRKQWESILV